MLGLMRGKRAKPSNLLYNWASCQKIIIRDKVLLTLRHCAKFTKIVL